MTDQHHEHLPDHQHGVDQPPRNRYFLDERIILYIEHPHEVKADDLAGLVDGSAKLASLSDGRIRRPNPNDIVTFPAAGAGPSLSVVPAGLSSGTQVGSLVRAIFDAPDTKPVVISEENAGHVLRLTAVSPSWLMPATPHGIGTGGPGGKPTAATPTADQWRFAFPVNPEVELNQQAGSGVHVLILDSFRNGVDLNNGLIKHASHPLLTGLLAPGRLSLQPGRPADLQLPPHTGAGGLRYRMADHGLFAAGIVHSLAREATVHLVEVLNNYGVGSFESIAKGLLHALAVRHKHGEARIIVNCSFMLSAPEPLPDETHTHRDYPTELDDPSIFTYMNQPFSDIIATLIRQGIAIVAAAGNDAEPGAARPAVRYPAAFDGVISVGALPRSGLMANWIHATYSNASGRVGKEGYLTLGGEPGTDNGVLGIYLDDFPEPLRANHRQLPENEDAHSYDSTNANGWGWWAGTSFAAPIVTGCIAALPAPAVPANSEAMVRAQEAALKQLTLNTPGVAPPMQNVLYVTQGL